VSAAESYLGAENRMPCVAHKTKNIIDKWLSDDALFSLFSDIDAISSTINNTKELRNAMRSEPYKNSNRRSFVKYNSTRWSGKYLLVDSLLALWPTLLLMKSAGLFMHGHERIEDFLNDSSLVKITLLHSCMKTLHEFSVAMQSRTHILITEGKNLEKYH
jgi:hypothetical protein